MLDSLRTYSKSWVSKALLLLLLVSFGIWGVSGQMLSSGGADAVITAGEILTGDLGGKASTQEMGDAIAEAVSQ